MAQTPKNRRSKTSRAWLREHVTDPYVRRAQKDGYRARAAYKLSEIDERDRILRPGTVIVDLGSAPGSWSQVAARRLGRSAKIFALDILPMEEIPGVCFLCGDFREQAAADALEKELGEREVDLVLSDMAPNMSGQAVTDLAHAYDLAGLALDFARKKLKADGTFLVKVFQGAGFEDYIADMRRSFARVCVRKPQASRNRSNEVYLLGKNFRS